MGAAARLMELGQHLSKVLLRCTPGPHRSWRANLRVQCARCRGKCCVLQASGELAGLTSSVAQVHHTHVVVNGPGESVVDQWTVYSTADALNGAPGFATSRVMPEVDQSVELVVRASFRDFAGVEIGG